MREFCAMMTRWNRANQRRYDYGWHQDWRDVAETKCSRRWWWFLVHATSCGKRELPAGTYTLSRKVIHWQGFFCLLVFDCNSTGNFIRKENSLLRLAQMKFACQPRLFPALKNLLMKSRLALWFFSYDWRMNWTRVFSRQCAIRGIHSFSCFFRRNMWLIIGDEINSFKTNHWNFMKWKRNPGFMPTRFRSSRWIATVLDSVQTKNIVRHLYEWFLPGFLQKMFR